MQVTVTSDYRNRTAHVTLEPLPEWRTRHLEQITVPTTLRKPSDVVTAIRARDDIDIRSAEKNRALRLIEALVVEARRRSYAVKAVAVPRKDRWGYVQRTDENTGHLKIALGPDEYRVSVYQLMDKVEHVASKSELARAGRGYAVPKWDHVPTSRLGIRIDTSGGHFWASSWTDQDNRPLDELLPQILQELELRHGAATDRRNEEERQRLERKKQWESARDKAVQKLTDSHRAEALMDQIVRRRNALEIRAYAAQVEHHAASNLDKEASDDVMSWAAWARSYADRIDPLLRRLQLPSPPAPTPTAIAPFIAPLSPYGPT